MKISIIEVKSALSILSNEIESSEGQEAFILLSDYVEQQRQKQIEDKTLITE
jgi:hypothetical protein